MKILKDSKKNILKEIVKTAIKQKFPKIINYINMYQKKKGRKKKKIKKIQIKNALLYIIKI